MALSGSFPRHFLTRARLSGTSAAFAHLCEQYILRRFTLASQLRQMTTCVPHSAQQNWRHGRQSAACECVAFCCSQIC